MEKHNRLTKKLRERDFKLHALLEITQAINANLSISELLEQYARILREKLGIQKLVLFVREENWKCLLHFGMESAVIPEVQDENFFSDGKQVGLEIGHSKEAFDLVIPIRRDERPIAYLLVGDIDENDRKISPVIKHMRFIQTLTNVLVGAIENKKLFLENLRQERVKKEIELAAEMQKILLPKELPRNDSFDVSAYYLPHQQVGGDYYDFMDIGGEEVMFCMADVSGKGVSAAFLMANFQAFLRAVFYFKRSDLSNVVRELNAHVMESAMGEKFITLFIGIFNRKSRLLQYVNCGHNPPVYTDEKGKTHLLELGCIGLGMLEELPTLSKGELRLASNAVIVCYTDGLVETENENFEQFGTESLEKILLENHGASSEEMNASVIKRLDKFRGEMSFVDDLALLTCRFF
ncbi:MAG: SpoIIE family protein phosphatase [Crocinitomicaceae bacterium]|nr:SpoIIE family protein phosphatase [Crocinitomicaceae bacterium]